MQKGCTDTKYAFRQHLRDMGFVMDQSSQTVLVEFVQYVGAQRFDQFQQVLAEVHNYGEEEANDRLCELLRDMREANLLRCISPEMPLEAGYSLYENIVPHLAADTRVLELNCWTGGLASFIAENHPDCTVFGAERIRRVLDLNRQYHHLPNLNFVVWDHRHPRPNDLEPVDLLLCTLANKQDTPHGMDATEDLLATRATLGYQRDKEEASRCFTHWRGAIKDGGLLLVAAKLFTFHRFLALIDAAQEAGWTALTEQFSSQAYPTNAENATTLIFSAQASTPISEDRALSHWITACVGKRPLATFVGPVALGLYRALGTPRVLAQRELRDIQGLVTKEELGICGAFGYILTQNPRPDFRLTLVSVTHAENERRWFEHKFPDASLSDVATRILPKDNGHVSTSCPQGIDHLRNRDDACLGNPVADGIGSVLRRHGRPQSRRARQR